MYSVDYMKKSMANYYILLLSPDSRYNKCRLLINDGAQRHLNFRHFSAFSGLGLFIEITSCLRRIYT